ncbi:hypothetical protein GGF39_003692 [Coemansia sp. RSA 1721]|nr:hypothetical protein GGF39_003692 [Coemansia sp. RSA 1721]
MFDLLYFLDMPLDGLLLSNATTAAFANARQAVDGLLLQLQVGLQRHDDSASLMVREIAQLIETKKQLAALQTQAREIRSVLGGLESLYTRLADSNTSWSVDLVQQESQYRQSRLQHYMHLQQTMDDQYTELCHDSVQMRVDVAARSFQRDLDNYVQWRSQPEAAAGSATGAKSQAAHTGGASAAGSKAKSIADVVLASGSWAGDSAANGFFSDDDDDNSSTKGRSKPQLGKKKGAGTSDDHDQAAPGVVILQDEDFD